MKIVVLFYSINELKCIDWWMCFVCCWWRDGEWWRGEEIFDFRLLCCCWPNNERTGGSSPSSYHNENKIPNQHGQYFPEEWPKCRLFYTKFSIEDGQNVILASYRFYRFNHHLKEEFQVSKLKTRNRTELRSSSFSFKKVDFSSRIVDAVPLYVRSSKNSSCSNNR